MLQQKLLCSRHVAENDKVTRLLSQHVYLKITTGDQAGREPKIPKSNVKMVEKKAPDVACKREKKSEEPERQSVA